MLDLDLGGIKDGYRPRTISTIGTEPFRYRMHVKASSEGNSDYFHGY